MTMNLKSDDQLDLFRRFIATLPKLDRFFDESVKGELLMDGLLSKAKSVALQKAVSELVVFGVDDHWSYSEDYEPHFPLSAFYDLGRVIARRDQLFEAVEKIFEI